MGTPFALLMPFDDDDLEWYPRERDPKFLASLAERVGRSRKAGQSATTT